jgi:inhibitor of cysteine peptidase
MQRFTDPAAAVRVAAGEEFALALPGNPSTGYTWQAGVDPRFLELTGREFEPGGAGVGAAGTEVLHFHALTAGKTEITCEQRRPWEGKSLKTTQFRVVIQ